MAVKGSPTKRVSRVGDATRDTLLSPSWSGILKETVPKDLCQARLRLTNSCQESGSGYSYARITRIS
jgi:hypothetical protein